MGAGLGEDMGSGATELECGFGCDGFDIGDATNAVRSEKFLLIHGYLKGALGA